MKKKVFVSGFATLVVVAVAAWNFNIGFNAIRRLSDTKLANIEALAQNEDEWICSICGNNSDNCTCNFGITCDSYAPDCPPPYYNRGRCWFPDIKMTLNIYCNWTGKQNETCCWDLW